MKDQEKSAAAELPLVTVLVGCYNHARFAVETLESVRLQAYPRIQLIIWDDCSRDNSVAVIQAWIQAHQIECTFLPHAVNHGLCRSLNEALALAQGKYIAMVATDDVWLPDRIRRQVQCLENAPAEVGVIYSDALQIDEHGKPYPQLFIAAHRQFAAPPEGWLFDVFWEGNFIPAMTTLIRRECYTQVGTYDEELCFEDWDMWLRISRKFRFVYDPVPAAKYRIVGTSMVRTMTVAMKQSSYLFKAKYYFRGWLNEAQSNDALFELEGAVWRLYAMRLPVPWRWRAKLLNPRRCSFRKTCLLACLTLGVPHATFLKIVGFGQTLKKKFGPQQPDSPPGDQGT